MRLSRRHALRGATALRATQPVRYRTGKASHLWCPGLTHPLGRDGTGPVFAPAFSLTDCCRHPDGQPLYFRRRWQPAGPWLQPGQSLLDLVGTLIEHATELSIKGWSIFLPYCPCFRLWFCPRMGPAGQTRPNDWVGTPVLRWERPQ
jgi:hypothetical protein